MPNAGLCPKDNDEMLKGVVIKKKKKTHISNIGPKNNTYYMDPYNKKLM